MTDLDDPKHHIKSECAKLDHAVIAASLNQWLRCLSGCMKAGNSHSEYCFDLDIVFSAITTTFLSVIDRSNTCTQIAIAWFSCQLGLCNTWPLSNLQDKVATLIRWGRLFVVWFRILHNISCIYLNLSKLCPKYCRSLFPGHVTKNGIFQRRFSQSCHHYVVSCKYWWDILWFFSHTDCQDDSCQKLLKVV